MNGGSWKGRQILSPKTVEYFTSAQLSDVQRRDMWDALNGYSYGKLMRVCEEPGRVAGLSVKGEYGWDGWLGAYFCNIPALGLTLLSMQNTTDCGTSPTVRKVRNVLLAAIGRGEI